MRASTMQPEVLRAAREEMGLTQPEAAKRYGLSLSGYKKYELGLTQIPGPVRILTKHLLTEHRKISTN